MSHIDRPGAFERSLIDLAGDLVAATQGFTVREADYRAQRDRTNTMLDAHRDADLVRLGYK